MCAHAHARDVSAPKYNTQAGVASTHRICTARSTKLQCCHSEMYTERASRHGRTLRHTNKLRQTSRNTVAAVPMLRSVCERGTDPMPVLGPTAASPHGSMTHCTDKMEQKMAKNGTRILGRHGSTALVQPASPCLYIDMCTNIGVDMFMGVGTVQT